LVIGILPFLHGPGLLFFTGRDSLTPQLLAQRDPLHVLNRDRRFETEPVSADHLLHKASLLQAGRHNVVNSIAAIPALVAAWPAEAGSFTRGPGR